MSAPEPAAAAAGRRQDGRPAGVRRATPRLRGRPGRRSRRRGPARARRRQRPSALARLQEEGLVGAPRAYASNELSLLVGEGNPQGVEGWADLTRAGVRVAFPDPETEGIGRLALQAIGSAGGDRLRGEVFVRNRGRGFVRLTSIHPRQGIAWLEDGNIDVAVVWQTEARHHLRAGRAVQEVPLPPEHNVVGEYAAAVVTGAPHRPLADAFVAHLAGPAGTAVYQRHGFSPPSAP